LGEVVTGGSWKYEWLINWQFHIFILNITNGDTT
jgi:hypothetical protein